MTYKSCFKAPCALILSTLLTVSGAAIAAAPGKNGADASVHAGLGTFGVGIGYGQRFSDRFSGRIGLHSGSFGSIKDDGDIEGIRYDVKAKLSPGVSALADYFPIDGSGFRLSGGLVYSRFKSDLTGRPAAGGTYNINGRTYTAAQVGKLQGKATYNAISPYLGIGWESKPAGAAGWRLVSDVGVFYLGKAKTSLSATGASANATLAQDVAAEREQLRKAGFGVAASIGAAYAF